MGTKQPQTYHILYLSTIPNFIGGAEFSLFELMSNLENNLFIPHFITSAEGTFTDALKKRNIEYQIINFPWFSRKKPWEYWRSILELKKFISVWDIDLIHTNCPRSMHFARRVSKLARIPYVSSVRDFARPWFDGKNFSALSQAEKVITNSKALAEVCKKKGIPQQNITTIYNPISIAKFKQAYPEKISELRAKYNLLEDSFVFGIIGQIQQIKGHTEFINASISIIKKYPNTHFLIIGSPPDNQNKIFLNHLETIINKSTFKNRFHFSGFQDPVAPYFQIINVLVIPSYREPFGRVAVEGLASGCAVIASNTGGLPEIITDHIDGLLVPPRSTEKLFQAMQELIVNNKLRKKIVTAGKKRSEFFSIDRHIQQIQSLYTEIINRHNK